MEKIKNMKYFHDSFINEEEKQQAVMSEADEYCKGNRLPDYDAEESIKQYLYDCIIAIGHKRNQSA